MGQLEELWQKWNADWNRFLSIARSRDWDYNELLIEPPASMQTLEAVEEELQVTLPEDFRYVVTHFSARVSFSYLIEDQVPIDRLQGLYYGGTRDLWSLSRLSSLRKRLFDWDAVPGIKPDNEPGLACVYPFLFEYGHNYIAFEITEGADQTHVFSINQDEHYTIYRKRRLADSFTEFMTVWSELGCPAPTYYWLEPFCDTQTEKLSSDRRHHSDWFNWIENPKSGRERTHG